MDGVDRNPLLISLNFTAHVLTGSQAPEADSPGGRCLLPNLRARTHNHDVAKVNRGSFTHKIKRTTVLASVDGKRVASCLSSSH